MDDADQSPEPPAQPENEGGRLRKRLGRRTLTEEQFERRFSAQFAKHWAQVRAERRHDEEDAEAASIRPGTSNFRPAQVPYGVDLAAAWSWRFIVIVAAGRTRAAAP